MDRFFQQQQERPTGFMKAFQTVDFGGCLHIKPYVHDHYGQKSQTVGVIGHLRPPKSKPSENRDRGGLLQLWPYFCSFVHRFHQLRQHCAHQSNRGDLGTWQHH